MGKIKLYIFEALSSRTSTSSSKDGNTIELIGIFEDVSSDEKRLVYRFAFTGPSNFDIKEVKITPIEKKQESPFRIEDIILLESNDQEKLHILSMVAKDEGEGHPFFKIGYPGFKDLKIGSLLTNKVVSARDILMVNPSIDGLFHEWIEKNEETPGYSYTLIEKLEFNPTFSIITPLFETPLPYLEDMLDSVVEQTYPHWELVLVNASPNDEGMREVISRFDDDRIKVIEVSENLGIAGNTNVGIEASTGDYVCFLDHDDILSIDVLAEYAIVVNRNPNIGLIYCDEDSIDSKGLERFDPRFKPELNPDLLNSVNYVMHFLAISRLILDEVELSGEDVSGSQDYDITLKSVEQSKDICRVPKLLYHWRCHEGSTNGGNMMSNKPYVTIAGIQALKNHFERIGIASTVGSSEFAGNHIIDFLPSKSQTTALAILSSSPERTESLISSLSSIDTSLISKIIIVGSQHDAFVPPMPFEMGIEYLPCVSGPSYSEMANVAVLHSSTDNVILCEDVIQFETDNLSSLIGALERPSIGVVAPKGFFKDNLVQHAGICIHDDGSLGFLNQNFSDNMGGGYMGTAEFICNFSAVADSCIAFKKSIFEELHGFSNDYEQSLITVVDFCLRARALGYLVTLVPQVKTKIDTSVFWDKRKPSWEDASNPDIVRLWENVPSELRRDMLHNPNVSLNGSYAHLNI